MVYVLIVDEEIYGIYKEESTAYDIGCRISEEGNFDIEEFELI